MSVYLTSHFPGIGGHIKECPEDFVVEEVPRYLPCGDGEHLYLFIEKQGMTTLDFLKRLARALQVAERDLGYAGLKDARALTRQWVSLPRVTPERVSALDIPGVRILDHAQHRNKLRPGHLTGNRFRILIRGVSPEAVETARDIGQVLEHVGVPNYFGEQRYGVLNNSHRIGHALLRQDYALAAREIIGDPHLIRDARWQKAATYFRAGDLSAALDILPRSLADEHHLIGALKAERSPREAVLAFPRRKLRLFLSAYQSWLFDRIVTMRLNSLDVLWPGDLAYIHDKGACFSVEDPQIEQPRADRFEISPSGPLFGTKIRLATAQAGILEESLLTKEGLSAQSFHLPAGLSMEGARRPLRVALQQLHIDESEQGLRLEFFLERGSYATSVLREIMKNEEDQLPQADPELSPQS